MLETRPRILSGTPVWTTLCGCLCHLWLLTCAFLGAAPGAFCQPPQKKNVLILSEVGMSHALTATISQQIMNNVEDTETRHVEFYSESLDLLSFPNKPSLKDTQEWLAKKYGEHRLDAVVAIGPDVISFLGKRTQSLFLDVPIVICGATQDQAGLPVLDLRFTGTWVVREPEKTLEVALRLFPETNHVFVVAGDSPFDKFNAAGAKRSLTRSAFRPEIVYLTDLRMEQVLQEVGNLPEHSVVFYLTYFEDAEGKKFVNATKALPMVAMAANAPVFGMSDTYLGHGIVGGDVMSFQKQGKITAQIVSDLLDGKKAQDFPIRTLPSEYMFDSKELQRWQIAESILPKESIVLFRQPTLWERTKWVLVTSVLIIFSLLGLAAYLQFSRKQLEIARERQRQLSGMLINVGEMERRRVANELHDDFSQRVAVIALKLESVSELVEPVSPETEKQLQELLRFTRELGTDLHSLSHRLHSSTLQSLGLIPAVSALCKEFTTQESVKTDFCCEGIPRSIRPDVALCSFRIVQESLRNIKKHSGASSARVDLHESKKNLIVTVRDDGCGFAIADIRQRDGLGLRSMEERASFLGGEFRVSSTPGGGTTIEARIPLNPVGTVEAEALS
jgi:signal transduction histidine kinase